MLDRCQESQWEQGGSHKVGNYCALDPRHGGRPTCTCAHARVIRTAGVPARAGLCGLAAHWDDSHLERPAYTTAAHAHEHPTAIAATAGAPTSAQIKSGP